MNKYKLITPLLTKSTVRKAKNIETNTKVALKFLKQTYDSIEEVSRIKEIQALKKLPPHPNIIKMIELLYDAPSGRVVLVLEHMDSDLHILNSDRTENDYIRENNAQNYIYQILKGIKHLHNNGLFHSNISTKNILVSKDIIKICDFSSCKGIFSNNPYSEEIISTVY